MGCGDKRDIRTDIAFAVAWFCLVVLLCAYGYLFYQGIVNDNWMDVDAPYIFIPAL